MFMFREQVYSMKLFALKLTFVLDTLKIWIISIHVKLMITEL